VTPNSSLDIVTRLRDVQGN